MDGRKEVQICLGGGVWGLTRASTSILQRSDGPGSPKSPEDKSSKASHCNGKAIVTCKQKKLPLSARCNDPPSLIVRRQDSNGSLDY